MRTEVTIFYLEMTSAEALRPKRLDCAELEITQSRIPLPEFNRFLYAAVGADWGWYQRIDWNYRQWQAWLERPGVQTWVAYVSGTPAGYFELDYQADAVELAYFGVLPRFIGQGLGGHLLTTAIEQAWQLKPARVWLHTCSLDHPHAFANYQARGFRLYHQETVLEELPEQALEPWAGAFGRAASARAISQPISASLRARPQR